MFDFDEQTIRDVIPSPYGQACMEAFFATLRDGGRVRVQRQDGTLTIVTTEAQARDLLKSFGWMPPVGG